MPADDDKTTDDDLYEGLPDAQEADAPLMPDLDAEDRSLPVVRDGDEAPDSRAVKAMMNVGLEVMVVLGSTRMPINQLLELSRGSIVELDRKIGAPVELHVAERIVARGDLVRVGENRLGVSLTQIVKDHMGD